MANTNSNLMFKRGLWNANMFGENKRSGSQITNFADGTIYFVTDQNAMYIDSVVDGVNQRLRVEGAVKYFNSLAEFTAKVAPPYSPDVVYFLANEDAFVRWKPDASVANGGTWVVLNATADTVNKISQDVAGLTSALNETASSINNTINALEAKLQSLISENKGSIGDLEEELSKTNSALSTLQNNHNTLSGEVTSLTGVVNT
jgi:hypothetical protein